MLAAKAESIEIKEFTILSRFSVLNHCWNMNENHWAWHEKTPAHDNTILISSTFHCSATSQRLNMFSRRKTSRTATSPRPARDQMIEKKLRRRLRDVSAMSRRRLRDVSATRRRRLRDDDWPTFIDLERKLSKMLKLVYTCKTWYWMYIDKIYCIGKPIKMVQIIRK